ncbi:hypothetical protein [Dactylosporangium sp. NPDC005555]|uniref:hypothetical protein n=1 Tax=Dactylosporangium sp. NPDC005555 TaxID=3154889 RepID=UPI0033B420E7
MDGGARRAFAAVVVTWCLLGAVGVLLRADATPRTMCGAYECHQRDIALLPVLVVLVLGMSAVAAGLVISVLARPALVRRITRPVLAGTVAGLSGPVVVGVAAGALATPWYPYAIVLGVFAVVFAVMTRIARS